MVHQGEESKARVRTAKYLLRCARQLGVTAGDVAAGTGINLVTAKLFFSGGCPHIPTLEKVGAYLEDVAKSRGPIVD